MVVCTRCGYRMDNTDLTECPLCRTPLPTANAAPQPGQPGEPPGPVSLPMQPQGVMPQPTIQQSMPQATAETPYTPQASGIPGMPPADTSGIPGVPPAGGYAPQSPPSASPLLAPGARRSLTGEIYEASPQQGPPPSYVGGGLPPGQVGMPPPRTGGPPQARPSTSPNRHREAATARSGSGGAIAVVLLVLLLLGGGGFGGYWYWMHRTNPKDQAQKFVDALKNMDYKAMAELSESSNQTTLSPSEVEQKLKQALSMFPGLLDSMKTMNYQVGEPKIDGDTASVPVTVSGHISLSFLGQSVSQDIKETIPFTLKNEGGIWKITGDANPLGSGMKGGGFGGAGFTGR
ncbi:MAG TPA: hypothetical protein VKU00_26840 [Chthonomonadaceae bacterium]|nr:hypothetical protein [Chthonomonadaceae bacterium]